MRSARRPWLPLALGAAAWASPPALTLQADPPIRLADYGAFQWASAAPAADSALSERARAAVARGFGARGLAGDRQGDIAVAVSLHVRMDFGARGPNARADALGPDGRRDAAVRHEGRLAIDIYDAASQRLIWRGLAAGPVDPASDTDIGRMVSALLAHASF